MWEIGVRKGLRGTREGKAEVEVRNQIREDSDDFRGGWK